MDWELLRDAVISGVLLGGFYAAVSLGLAIVFGLLDVPQIAHPAFVVVGGYGAVLLNRSFGIDPLLAGVLLAPAFFLLGHATYRFYNATFERRGSDASLRGLAFFFGIAFVLEVVLTLAFGVDQRSVQAPYIGTSLRIDDMRLPWRLLVACGAALVMAGLLSLYLGRTFRGRAIRAVAQDETALRILGVDPVAVKSHAFALATATVAVSGALLVIIGPIEPALGRVYIGKVFAIVVMAGLGSIGGTLVASLILGIVESVVLTTVGTSWTPAVAFGMLLAVLAVRPVGLFGR